jgi:creatine kinase
MMSMASSMLQEHAEKLLLEPPTPARDRQINRIVEQAIRICNRIKDSREEDQETAGEQDVKRVREEEECQRLSRLYYLKSIMMTSGEITHDAGYAAALAEKGDAFARMMSKEQDALVIYDQALVILGYDESMTGAHEEELADALQVARLLNRKGLLLMQQNKEAVKNASDFDKALECFTKGRKIAESRVDIHKVKTCLYFSLSADMLESEGLCYQHLKKPNDAVQKFEESLARKISIPGTRVSGILQHLWTILNGEQPPISTCGAAQVARVLSILCKKRPPELFAGKHVSDVDSVSAVVEVMSNTDASVGYSLIHFQEWGAATLRAFWRIDRQDMVAGLLQASSENPRSPYYTANDVGIAIHALLSALIRHRDHANIVHHTMQALLCFADGQGPFPSRKLREEIILTVLVALHMHKSNILVQIPALACIRHWLQMDPRAFLLTSIGQADTGKKREQQDEDEVREVLATLIDCTVVKMASDTHVINKCLEQGAVKTLLLCLENESTSDSALEILVMFSSDATFAKAMAFSGAQVALERAITRHASHESIQKNALVCMDKCREWFSRALEQKDGIQRRALELVQGVAQKKGAQRDARAKALVAEKSCLAGDLEAAKIARTEAAHQFAKAELDPLSELHKVDRIISESESAADSQLRSALTNMKKSSAPSKDLGSFQLPEIDSSFDTWLAAQLAASPPDLKDTDEFKYLTLTELPPWTDKHRSLMRKNMTQELFDKLKDVKSSKGYTLFNGMQAGVFRPHLGVGFTCGDEECFELFKDIINPIVKGWHQFDPATQTHSSDLNYDSLVFTEDDLKLFTKYVKSTRIRAARNISGFSLPAGSTKEDRQAVEKVLKTAFSVLPENLQGTYFPLGDLTGAQEDELQAGGFLFQKPGPMQLLGAAGAGRDWPSGRGIFHNPAKTVLCWCNEEDQCRIIAMENGGDVKGVFTRFCQLSNAIKAAAEGTGTKLMEHPNYGFLGTCPSNLGTGLRGSVMIVLENLNKDPHKLEEICASFDLQPRGSAGEHSAAVGGKWDISNKQRIGFTEVQLVQKMIDGVKKLIALEEELAAAAAAPAAADEAAAAHAAAAPVQEAAAAAEEAAAADEAAAALGQEAAPPAEDVAAAPGLDAATPAE